MKEKTAPGAARTAAAEEERYWRYALNAVFAVTALRLVWLALGRADLYPDEAQYWWWSLHPAFGYYSKPPMVAWLIALTTAVFGDSELAVRLAAPLLHFAAALFVFLLANRLYGARVAAWSAVVYVTLPGVSASAVIMSTDAPLMLCWAIALFALARAREEGGRWWIAVGVAAGAGLLSKYAMAYWLVSGFLFLVAYRDERRHVPAFLGASALALLIYAPNFVWNVTHGYASYRHTEANASFHGVLFHPGHFLQFFGSQFGVFGPLLFAALLVFTAMGRTIFADRRTAFLAFFTWPALVLMFAVSFLSRAEPNWAAPAYVSATVLVVAALLQRGGRSIVVASIALHVAAAVVLFEAGDVTRAMGLNLPARYDPLHRLHGYRRLGLTVSSILAQHPGAVLIGNDRETMAELFYYVHPHPKKFLKWNGDDNLPHDGFDLVAKPQEFIGQNAVAVSPDPNIDRIVSRFAAAGPVQHIIIPLGGGDERSYVVRYLEGFKGYR